MTRPVLSSPASLIFHRFGMLVHPPFPLVAIRLGVR